MSETNYVQRSRIEISLEYIDEKTAQSVAQAVSPDNINVPQNMIVETKRKGMIVVTVVESDKALETIISTVEDILSCVEGAEKALNLVRRTGYEIVGRKK